jgi:two-component system NarL family sensor kinase
MNRSASEILVRIAQELADATEVDAALEGALRIVADALALKTGWVWRFDTRIGSFYSAAAQNLPPYLQEPIHMTGASCWCIDSFRRGALRPGNIDIMQCSRLASAVGDTEGLRYHATIPLTFQGRPLGIMNVAGPKWRELTPDELELLGAIASQIGVWLERARLADEKAELARADERARMARDIHDTLAQSLTAVILHIESASSHIDTEPAVAADRLDRALAAAREGMVEARRAIADVPPGPLQGRSLPEALAAMARAFVSETGIRIRQEIDRTIELPAATEMSLYRIAQEALTNIRRHAGASVVDLALRHDETDIVLRVADNGRGMALEGALGDGRGIPGMRERAELIGAELTFSMPAGGGTAVALRLPGTA